MSPMTIQRINIAKTVYATRHDLSFLNLSLEMGGHNELYSTMALTGSKKNIRMQTYS